MTNEHSPLDDWCQEAFELGAEHGKNAASWAIDGSTPTEHYHGMVEWLDEGDPRYYDALPARPNLSGEWADDLTPRRLYEEITLLDFEDRIAENDDPDGEIINALCDAYERGVDSTFDDECERLIRRASEDDS